jgi:hypothetical protein
MPILRCDTECSSCTVPLVCSEAVLKLSLVQDLLESFFVVYTSPPGLNPTGLPYEKRGRGSSPLRRRLASDIDDLQSVAFSRGYGFHHERPAHLTTIVFLYLYRPSLHHSPPV